MNTQFEFTKESKQPQNLETGKSFKKIDLGHFKNCNEYAMGNKDLNLQSEGKIFLHDLLSLTSAEISINYAPAGYKAAFKHSHNQNEEVYIILKGKGLIEVDDIKLEIQEGSIVKIAPEGVRTMENTSDEDLIYIVVQAKAGSLEQFTLTDGKIV